MTQSIVVGLATIALSTLGQGQPRLTGDWSMDPSRSASAVQNEPIQSKTLRITEAEDTLTIDRTTDERSFTTRYRRASPGAPVFRADGFHGIFYWDGPRLVTETAGNVSDKTVRTRETYTIDSVQDELVVETVAIVEHGYAVRGGRNYATGEDVYLRRR